MADNVQQAVPFFWVRDLERSLRFYVDGLGCARTKAWIDDGKMRWCWLDLGQASIMLQEFRTDGPHRNLPEGKVGLGVSVNLICTDAIAIYRELKARGLAPKRPFVGNGMWVTQIADPDGYQLFFESPTDAPEESDLPEDEADIH
jgi:catechol 2,3-dioxygenase-like lactoylglutathione lyase family enzyme